jgi:hypothetical protein
VLSGLAQGLLARALGPIVAGGLEPNQPDHALAHALELGGVDGEPEFAAVDVLQVVLDGAELLLDLLGEVGGVVGDEALEALLGVEGVHELPDLAQLAADGGVHLAEPELHGVDVLVEHAVDLLVELRDEPVDLLHHPAPDLADPPVDRLHQLPVLLLDVADRLARPRDHALDVGQAVLHLLHALVDALQHRVAAPLLVVQQVRLHALGAQRQQAVRALAEVRYYLL